MDRKRAYHLDEEDPFLGKRVMWREPGYVRCAFCGKDGSARKCSGCMMLSYCGEECETNHKSMVHTPSRCQFARFFGKKWSDFPVIIGSDREKANCVFASRDIESGEEIIIDEALVSILFAEDQVEKKNALMHFEDINSIEGIEDQYTYIYHMTKMMHEEFSDVVSMGVYSTIAMGTDGEIKTIEKLAESELRTRYKDAKTPEQVEKVKFNISLAYGIIKKNALAYMTKVGNIHLCKAFFPLMSLINHSCSPNGSIAYIKNGEMILTITRAIKRGDEITIDYMRPSIINSIEERNMFFQLNHELQCKCVACEKRYKNGLFAGGKCLSLTINKIAEILKVARKDPLILASNIIDNMALVLKNDVRHINEHPRCAFMILGEFFRVAMDNTNKDILTTDVAMDVILNLFTSLMNAELSVNLQEWNVYDYEIIACIQVVYFIFERFKNNMDQLVDSLYDAVQGTQRSGNAMSRSANIILSINMLYALGRLAKIDNTLLELSTVRAEQAASIVAMFQSFVKVTFVQNELFKKRISEPEK